MFQYNGKSLQIIPRREALSMNIRMNFLRFVLTLVYVVILWSIICLIAYNLVDTGTGLPWGLIVLCVIGAGCHVVSATFYDMTRRLY